jgi:hypothetical protein
MDEPGGPTAIPLSVSSEWRTAVVATRPPELPKHDEYTLDVCFLADEPFLIARILEDGRRVRFSRDRASSASSELEEHLRFFPYDWHASDDVEINFGGMRHAVMSADLKRDPRELLPRLQPLERRRARSSRSRPCSDRYRYVFPLSSRCGGT